jgi:hypothetical protein
MCSSIPRNNSSLRSHINSRVIARSTAISSKDRCLFDTPLGLGGGLDGTGGRGIVGGGVGGIPNWVASFFAVSASDARDLVRRSHIPPYGRRLHPCRTGMALLGVVVDPVMIVENKKPEEASEMRQL